MSRSIIIGLMAAFSIGSLASPLAVASLSTANFLQQGHLDVTLKNVWMLNTTNAMEEADIGPQSAWAQGILLDYSSGWWQEWLGVDSSWYNVTRLYANEDFAGRDLLRDNNGHAEGFNKLGQIYLKTQWGDRQRHLRTKFGWHQLNKFGALTVTRSRAAPSSWKGVSLEAGYEPIFIKAAWVNQFSERDEPEKRGFYTLKTQKPIAWIITGDLAWRPEKGQQISLIAAESENYLRRQGVEVDWSNPLTATTNLRFRGVYYYVKGLSEWERARGFDREAHHLFASLALALPATEAGAGWSITRAKWQQRLGNFYWQLGKNTRGAFNSKADGPSNDYVNDGEQMLHAWFLHQITSEWRVGALAYYGFGMHFQQVPLQEWEYGGIISWSPQAIKGFSITTALGQGFSWKFAGGQPALNKEKTGFHQSKGIGGDVTVEYKFGLF